MEVRPRQGMQSIPKYFLPEFPAPVPLPAEWNALAPAPADRVLEARRAPAWRPIAVY
jgi:hypothetical protein